MKSWIAAAASATVLSLGAFAVPTVAQAQPSITVQVAPPPPRFERTPRPRQGYVWAPGHWEWRANRHVWIPGIWMRARPGYAYRAPHWEQHGGRWEYRQGRWDRDRHGGWPQGDDRRPGNPHRR